MIALERHDDTPHKKVLNCRPADCTEKSKAAVCRRRAKIKSGHLVASAIVSAGELVGRVANRGPRAVSQVKVCGLDETLVPISGGFGEINQLLSIIDRDLSVATRGTVGNARTT
jgi:hypothetical protein